MEIRDYSKRKQIRNLLVVIGSGVMTGFAIVLILLYNYNPSGSYLAKNVLLSPELAQTLSFKDSNPKTGGTSLFVFDVIEFSYYDNIKKQWKNVHVDGNQYMRFYQVINNEKSLLEVTDDVRNLFNKGNMATLLLKVRTESHAAWQATSKVFTEVNFVGEGDYYRVGLHEQNPSNPWAYFYHPGIYRQVLEIFVPKSS
jgi:hypothetical protein